MTQKQIAELVAAFDPFDILFSFLPPPDPKPKRRPKRKPATAKKQPRVP